MCRLWFDVEERYKTIGGEFIVKFATLWFDVEERYKTIKAEEERKAKGCGLM